MIPRIIPCLLLSNGGLYKTIRFGKRSYIGDPINTIKLFNSMEVDEIILLDIDASRQNKEPDFNLLREMAEEAFFPMCYGGGIKTLRHIERIIDIGFEKVSINQAFLANKNLIKESSKVFGSQSIVASVDVVKTLLSGHMVYDYLLGKQTRLRPDQYAVELVDSGAGELVVNSFDRDGMMCGFDIDIVKSVSQAVKAPIVACGGAGSLGDLRSAIRAGASAVAAGSLFIYAGRDQGVLINYPKRNQLKTLFNDE